MDNNHYGLKDYSSVGPINSEDIHHICLHYWYMLDLSQANFTVTGNEPIESAFVSHGRAIVARRNNSDPLIDLLASVHAVKVILPESVTRKQLNAAIKNSYIYQILVADGSNLFSMKDGNVWNKKGTILIYKQTEPTIIRCEDCGKKIVSTDVPFLAEGKKLCQDCLKNYVFCGYCYRYFSKDNPQGPKVEGDPCKECIELYCLD